MDTLTKWFRTGTSSQSSRVLTYHADRASMVLEMLDEAEVITKTACVGAELVVVILTTGIVNSPEFLASSSPL